MGAVSAGHDPPAHRDYEPVLARMAPTLPDRNLDATLDDLRDVVDLF
jgi:hypothetical protein